MLTVNDPLAENIRRVGELHATCRESEYQIRRIELSIERTCREIITSILPYLLSIYEEWRPGIGEHAVRLDFKENTAFEVRVQSVNGQLVRAQEGTKPVFHNFDLNPRIEEYEVARSIVPVEAYVKNFQVLKFEFLGPRHFWVFGRAFRGAALSSPKGSAFPVQKLTMANGREIALKAIDGASKLRVIREYPEKDGGREKA